MKKLIITMLCIPTICFGMAQPQRHVGSWIGREVNRWMSRSMQRAYTTSAPRPATNAELEASLKADLAQVQAKRRALSDGDKTKTWNETCRQTRLLENAKIRLKQDKLIDKILPVLKTRRTEKAKFDITRIHKNLDELYKQDQINTMRDWELRKKHDFLFDSLQSLQK